MTYSTVPEIALRSPKGEFVNEPFVNFAEAANTAPCARLWPRRHPPGPRIRPDHRGHARRRRARSVHQPFRPSQVSAFIKKPRRTCPGSDGLRSARFPFVERVPVEVRASLLLHAAEIIRERKFEFSAWLTYEVGKNWAEADADTAETIDFLEFYAREALRLANPPRDPASGEHNRLIYIRSVWAQSFLRGISFRHHGRHDGSAIVTGNTVILKPSSDSPTSRAVHGSAGRAGMPPAWSTSVPLGATFGNASSSIPRRVSSPYRSKPVGLDIHELAAKTQLARSGSSEPSRNGR